MCDKKLNEVVPEKKDTKPCLNEVMPEDKDENRKLDEKSK